MIEINLIPDVKRELLKAQRARAFVVSTSIMVSIIAGGVVVALLLYMGGVQNIREYVLDNAIKSESQKLAEVEDLSKILTIQNQLSVINDLNADKNIDSRIFNVLAGVVPPEPNNAQISQVTIDAEESTIRLEGQTSGYDAMEVFKKTLDSALLSYTEDGDTEAQTTKLASDISITDTSFGTNSDNQKVLRFAITFTYDDKLFSPDIDNVAIKLSIDGNVTDSYLGIPRSIFAERATDLQDETQ